MNKVLICALMVMLLSGCGNGGAETVNRVTEATKISDVINMFGDYGRLLFSVNPILFWRDK